MPVITIRIMGGADALKTEGLVLESMCMGHMGAGCQVELPVISICVVGMKDSEMMHIIGPRLHKATKVEGFRGKMWEDINWVSGNNIRELRDNSRGRWGSIPGLGGRVSIGRIREKSRARIRT
jgi:hypothetical protein